MPHRAAAFLVSAGVVAAPACVGCADESDPPPAVKPVPPAEAVADEAVGGPRPAAYTPERPAPLPDLVRDGSATAAIVSNERMVSNGQTAARVADALDRAEAADDPATAAIYLFNAAAADPGNLHVLTAVADAAVAEDAPPGLLGQALAVLELAPYEAAPGDVPAVLKLAERVSAARDTAVGRAAETADFPAEAGPRPVLSSEGPVRRRYPAGRPRPAAGVAGGGGTRSARTGSPGRGGERGGLGRAGLL